MANETNTINSVNSINSINKVSEIYDASLPELLNDFLIEMSSINKSVNTIKGYKIDLRLMFRYLKATSTNQLDVNLKTIDISDIDIDFIKKIEYTDLTKFMNFLVSKNNGLSDRARKVSAIKRFFAYLVKIKGIKMDMNPAINLQKPKIIETEPLYLSIEESKQLLENVKPDKDYKRNYCILAIFLNLGLRVTELCNINIDSIDNDVLGIIGKGSKPRDAYLNEKCIESIRQWLEERKKKENLIPDEDSKNALFLNRDYQRFHAGGIEKLVKKCMVSAGLDKKYTPHKLRHTCATSLFEKGVDMRSIQEILGHVNIETTTIYTHVNSEKRRSVARVNLYD